MTATIKTVTRGLLENPAAVAAIVSALVAAAALRYTAVQSQATAAQVAQAEQGQITTRYTSAVAQLGSPSLDVRLGGIYALERLTRDSPRDQPTIVEVLSAYVRDQFPTARTAACAAAAGSGGTIEPPSDVRAAITVLGRRDHAQDAGGTVNLTSVCLAKSDLLYRQSVAGADFTNADLTGAVLINADLTGADLEYATLTGVQLQVADLTNAYLGGANLADAYMSGADLVGANLTGTDLTNAHVHDARLTGADLTGADLLGADLVAGQLTTRQLGVVRRQPDGSPGTR